jgi:hypothetical protein
MPTTRVPPSLTADDGDADSEAAADSEGAADAAADSDGAVVAVLDEHAPTTIAVTASNVPIRVPTI